MSRDTELNQLLENWDEDKITMRPSAVDTFANCSRQWAMTFLGGVKSMPGARAAIGTAIHAAVEQEWSESILTRQKNFNVTAMADRAEAELAEMDQEGLNYDTGESLETAIGEAAKGSKVFAEDIVPFTDIPLAVEERYSMDLNHPVIERLSGTVDYISSDTIADVKTSKRKPVPQSYSTQQSIYKILAEHNGRTVKHSMIQGVTLKAKPEGHILELTPEPEKAKVAVNTVLDVTGIFHQQVVSPDILFRGNPKYYLCSSKYCALHATCPYVQGKIDTTTPKKVTL